MLAKVTKTFASVSILGRYFSSPHPTSQKGFDKEASTYEKGRPSYPKIATDLLSKIKPNNDLLEIGSGSGKFTSILHKYFPNSNLTSVEPIQKFNDILKQKFEVNNFQTLQILQGNASDITKLCGLKSMDAIFVAQAFHWFTGDDILHTFSEVLRQNGYLFLIWNKQVYNTPFLTDLQTFTDSIQLTESKEHNTPVFRVMKNEIESMFNGNKYFEDAKYIKFENSLSQKGDYNMILNRILSKSSFAVKNDNEKESITNYVKQLIVKHYGTLDVNTLELPYNTYVILTQCKV